MNAPSGMRANVLAILAVCLAGLLPAAAQGAVPRAFFGVMVNGPALDRSVDLDAQARIMRAHGVGSWRIELAWDLIEPHEGRFTWRETDRQVRAAARAGIDILAIAHRSPPWLTGDLDPFMPPDPKRFGRFCAALVGRYGPRGSFWRAHPDVPRRPIRAWQVWNEPDQANFLVLRKRKHYPRVYARMLRASYTAIKRADRRSTVVMAGMTRDSWNHIAKVLAVKGPRLRFDGAAVHPYTATPEKVLRIIALARKVLDRDGRRRTPIWVTEMTWTSSMARLPINNGWARTPAGQARALRATYRLLLERRTELLVQRAYWYTWASPDSGVDDFDWAGLVRLRPGKRTRLKPALRAFKRTARVAARRY